MSHDIYFTKPRISQKQFGDYFRSRCNYEVSESQAFYKNEDTGVYFMIDYNEPEEGDSETIDSTASLSVNYYRPHVFALEAVDEVSAFIEQFGFSIHDPQNEGMGTGPFSKSGYLRSWNHGNEFGYSAILRSEHPPEKVFTLPGERLETIWKWNLQNSSLQKSVSEDIFVSRILYMVVDERVVSVVVWPDAIVELIPKVDFLLVGRDELAPKPLFGSRNKDQILVPFGDFVADLAPFATTDYFLPAYRLPARVPEQLRSRIRKLKQTGITGEGISADQVLNEEIVMKLK